LTFCCASRNRLSALMSRWMILRWWMWCSPITDCTCARVNVHRVQGANLVVGDNSRPNSSPLEAQTSYGWQVSEALGSDVEYHGVPWWALHKRTCIIIFHTTSSGSPFPRCACGRQEASHNG
jgi:hypothetical protein